MSTSGNGTNPDCSSKLDDPDITGLLVILAFVLTLIITFCTVLYTYLSISLPRTAYNDFDALVIPGWVVRMLPASGSGTDENGRRRLAAWTSLVLAMSDQHLVTGTAMLITTYAITGGAGGLDGQRSVYSLRVATCLATCAAIVHISTLSVLRFRFSHRTVDSATRHVAIVVFVGLTFGARIASSFTSDEDNSLCVSESSVRCGLDKADPKPAMIRIAATVMEMAGLWICLYRNLKACLHVGGLRSLVRFCLLREKLKKSKEKKIQVKREGFLSRKPGLYPLFMVMKLSESSLIDILWLSLFFVYSLAEIGRIYSGRVNLKPGPGGTPPNVVIEPSFGQLMPMLVLTGSLLGVLTTWKETNQEQSSDASEVDENGEEQTPTPSKTGWNSRLLDWIKNIGATRGDQLFHSSGSWSETDGPASPNNFVGKHHRLAWIVFLTGAVAMTGLVFIRIMTITVSVPGKTDVLIWHYVFMAAVGLYFVLHVLASIVLAIDDAKWALNIKDERPSGGRNSQH